ncbi:unnamed protein product [Cyclocybe aegerita]|uniref:Alpha/beta hydrolase fold-3 domain-containing protein n=1 Tax=Cyclocybe aegerita TaxID=1973307 RepID=A0A8S0WPM9_CYCAE|nr:unnamed protein product [Cyclocybe aegerita]
MATTKREYGKITGKETLGLFAVVLMMPIMQVLRLLRKPFVEWDRVRSWRRVKAEGGFGYAVSVMNAYQLQFVDGSSQKVYEKWAPTEGVKVDVEKIGDSGAQLLWATPRGRKRVIVYFHGGGYVLPTPPFTLSFWNRVTKALNEKGKDVGLAFLEYSLVPKETYPVPMKQTIAMIKHLISAGTKPEDIFLVGDSAGAALILQVVSQILHPIPDIPSVDFQSSKLGAIILISPFVTFDNNSPSWAENGRKDIFPPSFFTHLSGLVKPDIPESQTAYAEAVKAPEGWFKDVDILVSRAFITAGANECLRDDITKFAEAFKEVHSNASFTVIPRGTHNEPYGTFVANEPDKGEWPPRITEWLAEGML